MINKIITVFLLSIIGFVFLAVINSSIENQYPSEPLVVEGYEFDYLLPDYGSNVRSIKTDDTYIYVGGAVTQKVQVYDKATQTLQYETGDCGGQINDIEIDNNNIYVGCNSTTVKVYEKTNPTVLLYETADYGDDITTIEIDDNNIYVAGDSVTGTVRVYEKTNPTVLLYETPNYGGNIEHIEIDDTYIYVGGSVTETVQVYDKVTQTLQYETGSISAVINKFRIDDNYIYIAGGTTIKIYEKTSPTILYDEINSTGTKYSLYINNDYIYTGGTNDKVEIYSINDTTTLFYETADYGGTILAINVDDNFKLYFGGDSIYTPNVYSPITSGGEVDTPPLVGLIPIVAAIAVIGSVVFYIKFKR